MNTVTGNYWLILYAAATVIWPSTLIPCPVDCDGTEHIFCSFLINHTHWNFLMHLQACDSSGFLYKSPTASKMSWKRVATKERKKFLVCGDLESQWNNQVVQGNPGLLPMFFTMHFRWSFVLSTYGLYFLSHLKRGNYQFPTKCPLEDFDGFGVVRVQQSGYCLFF